MPVRRAISQESTVPKQISDSQTAFWTAGSFAMSHAHFPAETRGASGRPVLARNRSELAASRSHTPAERPHCQLTAFDHALPVDADHAIAVSLWLEIATASMCAPVAFAC